MKKRSTKLKRKGTEARLQSWAHRQKVLDEKHKDLHLARATAIESYADLEQQLGHIFTALLGTSQQKGALVFYRITNTHSRNRMLESLLRHEYGEKYKKFWDGAFKLIRKIDQRRNEIVHWTIVQVGPITEDGVLPEGSALSPHGFWANSSESEPLFTNDLFDFVDMTEFLRLNLMFFHLMMIGGPLPEGQPPEPWFEIFQQPLSYPPPKDAPQFQIPEGFRTPPRSTRG